MEDQAAGAAHDGGHAAGTAALLFFMVTLLVGIITRFFLGRVRLPFSSILLVSALDSAARRQSHSPVRSGQRTACEHRPPRPPNSHLHAHARPSAAAVWRRCLSAADMGPGHRLHGGAARGLDAAVAGHQGLAGGRLLVERQRRGAGGAASRSPPLRGAKAPCSRCQAQAWPGLPSLEPRCRRLPPCRRRAWTPRCCCSSSCPPSASAAASASRPTSSRRTSARRAAAACGRESAAARQPSGGSAGRRRSARLLPRAPPPPCAGDAAGVAGRGGGHAADHPLRQVPAALRLELAAVPAVRRNVQRHGSRGLRGHAQGGGRAAQVGGRWRGRWRWRRR
jgi:hypothetical protein